jgi:membrane-associated HD superfamily phosphohydrolase
MGRFILLILLLAPLSSWAEIYRWTDASGQVHFGEQPGAGAERIEVKPQVVERDAATRESQERLRKVLDAHQQEQNATAQKQAGKAAEHNAQCSQLRQALANLQAGGRYFSENATGERTYYSDQQIAAARSKISSDIATNCK